jgi:hypothetical protein
VTNRVSDWRVLLLLCKTGHFSTDADRFKEISQLQQCAANITLSQTVLFRLAPKLLIEIRETGCDIVKL